MKGELNKEKRVQWFAAVLIFLQIEPYFVWPLHTLITYYNTIPFILILLTQCDFNKISIYEVLFLFIALLAAVCARYNIFGIVISASLMLLFLCKKEFLIEVFLKFRKIYVVLIALSMTVWLLLLLGINIPYKTVPPLNTLKEYTCNIYPFLVKINGIALEDDMSNAIRFMGLFDEPGVVGTVSLMMLYIGKFDLKKGYNIVLLLSGIISFSLFFYVATSVFMLYSIVSNKSKIRTKIFLFALLFMIIGYSFNNPVTKELIWDRLEWDSSRNTIVGNNRSGEEFDNYIKSIKGTSAYYWGVADPQVSARFMGAASINNAIIRHGFVVLVLFFIFYALYSKKYIKSFFMWCAFMAFMYLTLYQRPGFFSIHYILLFNMAIMANSTKYSSLFVSNNP